MRLLLRRRVWRVGRVRRGVREVRVGILLVERSREWRVGGRLLVLVVAQEESWLLARMSVWRDGKEEVIVVISSGLRSVSLRARYLIFGK
jgi:hypothetical protein